MARKPITDMSTWPSLSLEGNLIAPAMIAKIDQRDAPEQSPEDYSVRKGLSIREEVSTAFRVGQSHFDAFAKLEAPSQDATRRFVNGFFKETFNFDDLETAEAPLAFTANSRVPIVVVPPSEAIDRRSPTLSVDRARSPAFALQDYLNDKEEALWGIVTNGIHLRLMRDNASLTRPAYIEVDLAQIFSNEDIASFAVLWLLIHRSRFGNEGAPATDCPLERWRETGSKEGAVARDRLADQVQIALKVLGSGFLEANPDLSNKLKSGEVNLTRWFNELLRLVYRLIFLMVAEDRNLLHPTKAKNDARALYAQGYSLAALRKQCYRAVTWNKHHDRYEGVKIVFHALANGQDALALPALGGLFADDRLPHLETARLRNKAFMEALYRLSWLSDKTGMVPVNWRAMETEELGSVYESLLELQPQLGDDGKTLVFASEAAEQKGNQRKTTGSYYTPDSLVQALLDTALDPVLDKTDPDDLLKLTIIDPACGSGHFLLAAARRIATRLARHRAEGTPALSDFRLALRDVARSCLHGVDRNPMAVELTMVALWIETVDPGLPLGFFDAQIRCGDALLGVFDLKVLEDGIPDAAYKPLTGDDQDTAKYYKKANQDATNGQGGFDFGTGQADMPAVKPLALDFSDFRDLPEDTVEQIGAKAKRFTELRKKRAFVQTMVAANLYVAAFLLPKVGGASSGGSARAVPTTEELWMALDQGKIRKAMVNAPKVAQTARAFHWPLEFPDIMHAGGFDVVLGNPPWEVMQFREEEYFASLKPAIAALPGAARKLAIAKLSEDDAKAFADYNNTKREFEAIKEFVRSSEHFKLTAKGKINTYALFSELSFNVSRKRVGLIVPTGLVTDFTTRLFFGNLLRQNSLVSALMFDNAWKIFPAIHADTPFALLTLGFTDSDPEFASYLLSAAHLKEPTRRYRLSAEEIFVINPNTMTAPLFRTQEDAKLTTKLLSNWPILVNESDDSPENPWEIEFRQGLFNMSSDSGLFQSAESLDKKGYHRFGNEWEKEKARYVPLYEAKMIHQFDHRWASYDDLGKNTTECDAASKLRPDFEPQPRYWVPSEEVANRLETKGWDASWLMGWRDVTNATNERTVICAVMPRLAVNHKTPLFFTRKFAKLQPLLLANLNSLVFDFVARQKVGGTSLAFFYVKQLPIIPPTYYTASQVSFVTSRVLRLTYTSNKLDQFAHDMGYDGDPFVWDEENLAQMRAELDAFYACAYGLSRSDLRYILDPSDMYGLNYPSQTFRVLKDREIRQNGEYRTGRLVLAAWDKMQTNGEFQKMGMR